MRIEDEFYAETGFKRLRPSWAKIEIALGLSVAVLGLRVLIAPPAFVVDQGVVALLLAGSLAVLGLYLAMAGHRSHLYQSQNRVAMWIVERCVREPASRAQAAHEV